MSGLPQVTLAGSVFASSAGILLYARENRAAVPNRFFHPHLGSGCTPPSWTALPTTDQLEAPYPNPFNGTVKVTFQLTTPQHISLTVWNLLGQQVALLKEGDFTAGRHSLSWTANTLAAGNYFLRLRTKGGSQMRRITLVE